MKDIDVIEYLPKIITELKQGILLNTKSKDKINSMTIAWGQIGIEWRKLIFTAYVRHSRFTHQQIEESKEFTVSVPLDRTSVKEAIAYCGTKCGKDINKLSDMNLTVLDGIKVNSPAIKELPLTLECKVIYQKEQDKNNIPKDVIEMFYPDNPLNNGDYHTVYYGEIVGAYII